MAAPKAAQVTGQTGAGHENFTNVRIIRSKQGPDPATGFGHVAQGLVVVGQRDDGNRVARIGGAFGGFNCGARLFAGLIDHQNNTPLAGLSVVEQSDRLLDPAV